CHACSPFFLLGFLVGGVFLAETAVFAHFQPVRIVFLVFHCVVVALFALRASQGYFYPHVRHLLHNRTVLPPSKKRTLGFLSSALGFVSERPACFQTDFCTKK